VSAHAYTVGQNIVFAAGRFAPATQTGRRLIAHELTHVIQQIGAGQPWSSTVLPAPIRSAPRIIARAPNDPPPSRSEGLTASEWARIREVRRSYNLPDTPTESQTTIVGILILPGGEEIPLKSGEEGGVGGGTHRGNIPRGRGEAFSGGGMSQGNIASHIEGHAAAIMHQRNISEARLLIEAPPCKICDSPHGTANITRTLPPGAKLTIVDPEAAGTYWSSQRPPPTSPQGAAGEPEPKKPEQAAKKQTASDEPDKPASSKTPAKQTEPGKTPKDLPETKPATAKPAAPKPSAPAKTSKSPTPSTPSAEPTSAPAKAPQTRAPKPPPKPPPKAPTKAADVPAGKPKAKPSAPPSTPTVEPTTPGSKPLSATGEAAVKTFNGLMNQYAGKATKIATSDPQIAATYTDLMHLMDAKALVEHPQGFAAQKLANYFLDSAFTKLARQLAQQEAAFWNKYPDVRHFHQIDVGSGQTLDSLKAAYADATRDLQKPGARQVLTTAFVMLGLPENAPQSEINKRIAVINAMLAQQPGIGPYVQRYNEAQKYYMIALQAVWADVTFHVAMLDELPKGSFDQIRRRGDLLIDTAKILDELAEKVALLSALPGGDAAWWLVNTVAEGVRGLGEGLQGFASQAGDQRRLYQIELDRLSAEIDHINNLHGAFDVIYGRSSP